MPKKVMTMLAAVIFLCIPLVLMSGCGGKGATVTDESFTPSGPVQPAQPARPVQPARPSRPDREIQPAEDQEARGGEKGGKGQQERGGKGGGRGRDAGVELPSGPSQAEVEAFENTSIFFDFDRSELRPEARSLLSHKAAFLKNNKDLSIRISGHCDERGTNEYNMALGERRAEVAKKFLVGLGVDADRITTVSFGEERPKDPGHNEDAWSKNRRDDFEVIQ